VEGLATQISIVTYYFRDLWPRWSSRL